MVLGTISSVDWHSIYYGSDEQREFVISRLKQIVDSLEQAGDLDGLGADTYRGMIYNNAYKRLEAEEWYSRAITHNSRKDREQWYYNDAGYELANLLYIRHNYEGFLRVAVPLLASMDSLGSFLRIDHKIDLYSLIGCCYLKLEQPDKAKEAVMKARDFGRQVLAVDTSHYIHQSFINYYARIKDAYVRVKDFEGARNWMAFTDSIGNLFARRYPNADVWPIYNGYTHLDRAIKVWSLGMKDSAAAEYAEFRKYKCAYDVNGLTQSNDYLMNAERWADAADNYQALDWFIKWNNEKLYLEELYAYYFPKFRANYNAGRKDSALFVANQIAEAFDSAYIWQKRSSMAEMATVYDTQGKEMQIARQQAELSQQRLWGTAAALVLLTTFFIIYTLHRRKAQKHLATAHRQLETAHTNLQAAYDQLEETTAAKERIESELRIARDIQMSMVPGIFPEREGLDMYAEMTPAKEVGGDLYGYVLQGDQLYFCVGDVSGKGVPASLFMAQSARLFRTLATEGMMPADIAFRMNNELSEGNDSNMFVTMFIGLCHLDTGRLDYCNCGHNEPFIDGQFLEMQHVNQMIGFIGGISFVGETIDDIRGHQLLIYTDGLNEAENLQQEQLGNDRLLQVMSKAGSLDSHQVIAMLKKTVEEHRAGADPNDDLTLMCLKLT
jgi:serine phosphatase RsbU (regulator of sigma subunit)